MKKIFLLLTVITMTTCKKDVVTGPQGPKGDPGDAVATGSITGKVSHYDANANKITTGLHNSTVTLEGQNKSTVTDAAGNYTISGVSPGIYTMKFERPETGIYKYQQISFPGNGNLIINVALHDRPQWQLTSFVIKDSVINTAHFLKMVFGHPQFQQTTTAFVYFSRTDNIDTADPSTYDTFIGVYLANNSTQTVIPPQPYSPLIEAGYVNGTVFYAKVFPMNPNGSFLDYSIDQNVYPNSGTPLPSVALVMP